MSNKEKSTKPAYLVLKQNDTGGYTIEAILAAPPPKDDQKDVPEGAVVVALVDTLVWGD
jgi:hypothetical protein